MINYKLNINKGLWHVNFYTVDIKGKSKRKQLSTGIKAYDDYGRKINKRKADEKAKEIVAKYDGMQYLHSLYFSFLIV